METEFKIPAHPPSDSLFSKHAITSYTPRMSGGDVGSKFNPSSTREGGFPHAQKPFSPPRNSVKGSSSGSIPCRVKSPKEKHLVKKSPSRSKVPPHLKSTLPQAKTSSLAFLSPATASNAPTPASTPVGSECAAELQHLASTADICADSSAASTSDVFLKPRPVTESTDSAEVDTFQKPFYFETDHLALKTNQDYQNLLRTICLLEAQRIKAIDDLDKLLMGQEKALEDPIGFVQKLQNKEDLKLPRPQKVPEVPVVNWDNYSGSLAQEMMQAHPHRTRSSGSSAHDGAAERGASLASSSQNAFSVKNLGDKNRSESFNKPWSIDEQKRLEQLLLEFPPEEVEARRWDKIARALGNRTMHQVASRVQKYFIKLAKARLPIPGRMPNMVAYGKKGHMHRHQRFNRHLNPASTFLASYEPPVHMPDIDDDSNVSILPPSVGDGSQLPNDSRVEEEPMEEVSDDESIPVELRDSEEYRQILALKRMRRRKIGEEKGLLTRHIGYKCDSCNCDPIIGPRWHCKECPEEISVDFCSDCIDMNYEDDMHKTSHKMEVVRDVLSHIDKDYTKFAPSGYNYLDPNYMPAS